MLLKAIFFEGIEHQGLSEAEMCEQAKATECGAKLEPLKNLTIKYKDRIDFVEKHLDTLEHKVRYNNNRKIVSLLKLNQTYRRSLLSRPRTWLSSKAQSLTFTPTLQSADTTEAKRTSATTKTLKPGRRRWPSETS